MSGRRPFGNGNFLLLMLRGLARGAVMSSAYDADFDMVPLALM